MFGKSAMNLDILGSGYLKAQSYPQPNEGSSNLTFFGKRALQVLSYLNQ